MQRNATERNEPCVWFRHELDDVRAKVAKLRGFGVPPGASAKAGTSPNKKNQKREKYRRRRRNRGCDFPDSQISHFTQSHTTFLLLFSIFLSRRYAEEKKKIKARNRAAATVNWEKRVSKKMLKNAEVR